MREQGVAALSLREVARRVHMQAPSLYAYFPSKMALYDALFLMAVRLRAEYRDRADAGREGFWDRLEGRFESYMRFAQENPELYQLAFERPVPGFVPSAESLEEAFRAPAGLEQMLADAVAAGRDRAGHAGGASARSAHRHDPWPHRPPHGQRARAADRVGPVRQPDSGSGRALPRQVGSARSRRSSGRCGCAEEGG